MKGVSYWLWVAGSVVVGLLIFAAGYKYLSETSQRNAEMESVESFQGLVNNVNNLCWEFVGNKRQYTLSIYKTVKAIYASDTKSKKFSEKELEESVENALQSEGEYLCIQIKGKRPYCEKLDCNVSIPFLGFIGEKPNFQSVLNELMGKGSRFKYELTIKKESDKVVVFVGVR